MILLQVNKNEYKAFQNWSEVPLSLGAKLHELCVNEMPVRLKSIYGIIASNSEDKEKELSDWYASTTDVERIKEFPTFYGKVIALLTDIPKEIIDHLNASNRDVFYKTYCESFVFGILYFPTDYTIQNIPSFKYKNLPELFLPVTKEVLGVKRPMFDRTAIEFTEAADLEIFSRSMAGGKFEVAANIISILCRPMKMVTENGTEYIEPYNEDTCLKRAEELADLPMDIVFEVFFCLAQHIALFNTLTTTSLIQAAIDQLKKVSQAESKNSDGTQTSSKQPVRSIWSKRLRKRTSMTG